jgi:hypothetical protein
MFMWQLLNKQLFILIFMRLILIKWQLNGKLSYILTVKLEDVFGIMKIYEGNWVFKIICTQGHEDMMMERGR